jgi:hypothetical protein
MEQLPFDFTTLTVKINRKKLLLGDWQQVKDSQNWMRRLIPDDGFSCILLMVSWVHTKLEGYSDHRFHWSPSFLGRDLHDLDPIYYNSFYPNEPPLYRDDQIKEVKQHLDNFIGRVNSLGVFL